MSRPVILGTARMDMLAARFAGVFGMAEALKVKALEDASDVTPDEMVALLLRGSVAWLSSAIEAAAHQTGSHVLEVKQAALQDLDENLADGLLATYCNPAPAEAGRA